ncbi:MAG: ankyrin repeat domain-containing protein [Acidobacteria bacterium]|nr:ankyrin repeat domain-containing protein [Acidobacteriota bacterium]
MSKTEDLVQASFDGRLDLVRSLIEEGVNINRMGHNWNPLHAAIENWQIDVINHLLTSGADTEYICSGMRPLHHVIDLEIDAATQANDSEYPEPIITRILLDAGANINGKDHSGMTPLKMAIDRGHKKAEKLLRSRGAV